MANTFTWTFGVNLHTDAGTITSTTDSYTSDTDTNFVGTFNAGASNSEIDIAATLANLKALYLYADQDMTVKTNSAGSPADTIALKAKKQIVWNTDSFSAKPYTTNVTKLYVSCTATTVLRVGFLADQTP